MKISFRKYWELLSKYLRPRWRTVALLAVLLFGGIGLQLVNPQIVRYFIDTATSGGETSALTAAAAIFIGVAVVRQAFSVGATWFSETVGWNATNDLRADLALHCLRLDMSFHNDQTPGELIERLDGDIESLAQFFSQFVVTVLGNLMLLLGVVALLFWEDWRVGSAFAVYSAVSLLALNLVRSVAVPRWKEAREANAELFGFLEERLGGTEDIRSCGAENFVMRGLYQAMGKRLHKELDAGVWTMAIDILVTVIFTAGRLLALCSAYFLFKANVLSIGAAYIIVHYIAMMFRPLHQLTMQLHELQKAGGAILRIEELRERENRITDGHGPGLQLSALAIEFDHVAFGYNEEEAVLRDMSFRIEPGEALGLLGRTGSGKSTIARLLFRQYDPGTGFVRLDGRDIRTLPLEDLRRHVGMVTQEVQLFAASVRENLTFFNDEVADDRILAALDELSLSPWLRDLPDGLDTPLTPGGGGLSAGEAQLLAFTRVFLKDPGLVILDEASSRLDPATERLIEQAVDRLLEGRSAIIIAHRLATVDRADQILILEDGGILEYGERRKLVMEPGSHFSQLLGSGLGEVLE